MDATKFDAIARSLAGRLSRRAALRSGGAAGIASLVAAMRGGHPVLAQETPTPLPVCADPDRPGVGCACTLGTNDACGPTTLLCCPNDVNSAPGSPGTCTPSSVGCNPRGPLSPTCTARGCRCDSGTQHACGEGLVCCPDNPGLAGGPGHCVRQDRCNQQNCTGEGCSCNSGVQGACDDGLVCCADDPSTAGGPGRCEDEQVCFTHQCQATTNPCPSSCTAGKYCQACCAGHCGQDGHCGPPPCTGFGCECNAGVESACDEGLTCCQSQTGTDNVPGGPGQCVAANACGKDACLDIGCPCTAGVEGTCAPGLVCCQSQMTAPNKPGGPGMCAAPAGCGNVGGEVTPGP
jgi:hypothetical protein